MDKAARAYDRESEKYLQYDKGLKLMDLLSITENSKVLDLGCGTGLLTKALGERVGPGGKVVGVDPDKARIQLAREKYGSSNVVFLEGSTDDFPQDQYDFVYSNFVFHWVQDKVCAFKNVYKNLKPGGRFGIQISLIEDYTPVLIKLLSVCGEETVRKFKEKDFTCPLTVYEQTAKKYGFCVDVQDDIQESVSFPDMESLMDWWYGTTEGLFKPELVDEYTLKTLKETYKCELRGNLGIMVMTKN